jgi:hypothetical protein
MGRGREASEVKLNEVAISVPRSKGLIDTIDLVSGQLAPEIDGEDAHLKARLAKIEKDVGHIRYHYEIISTLK